MGRPGLYEPPERSAYVFGARVDPARDRFERRGTVFLEPRDYAVARRFERVGGREADGAGLLVPADRVVHRRALFGFTMVALHGDPVAVLRPGEPGLPCALEVRAA